MSFASQTPGPSVQVGSLPDDFFYSRGPLFGSKNAFSTLKGPFLAQKGPSAKSFSLFERTLTDSKGYTLQRWQNSRNPGPVPPPPSHNFGWAQRKAQR